MYWVEFFNISKNKLYNKLLLIQKKYKIINIVNYRFTKENTL